ncbi:hypothetical protein [Hyalangium gracile]|uniref:hypothetical protein n=1 Tax=Hyalangium gracile TaxID=394092 RepID=UPI001CC94135|nr:hypothetical protein [Hyalangium gracile]
MNEPDSDHEERSRPSSILSAERFWWVLAALTCVTVGLPMLFVKAPVEHTLVAWLVVVLVYLGLLLLFGRRFVLEGAILAFLLAVIVARVLHVVHGVLKASS